MTGAKSRVGFHTFFGDGPYRGDLMTHRVLYNAHLHTSGPAHFASLTPIHVVTLFGPETPALFAARSPSTTTLWAGIPCSPCVNAYNNRQSVCRDNLCMQAITVDDVFEKVTQIYDSGKRKTADVKLHNDGFPN